MLKIISHPRPEFNGKYCIVDVLPDSQTHRMTVQGYYVGSINQYQPLDSMKSYSCPHVYLNKTDAQAFLQSIQTAANDT